MERLISESEYLFKYGAVSGVTNGAPVKVLVVPNNSFNSTSAVTLDGQFADTSRISIVADAYRSRRLGVRESWIETV